MLTSIHFSLYFPLEMFGKKESYNYTNLQSLDRLDTFVGRTTGINGSITTQGSVRVDGQIEGNINVSETIITGNESFIKGIIKSKNAIIAGRVEGNIIVSECIELQPGANVNGDITCGSLIIGKNCFFEGKCHMETKEQTTK
jgi:cytoskeletal protein CcmA (bactofilin family)